MDREFFRSKEFGIAAAICALVLVAGTVAAVSWGVGSVGGPYEVEPACDERAVGGDAIAVAPVEEVHTRGRSAWRVITYELNASDLAGGAVDLCAEVGHIEIVPSPDLVARLVFTVESTGAGAADAVNLTEVEARFARESGGLSVAGWQATHVHVGRIFGSNGAEVRIELQLPQSGPYDVTARSSVGFVSLDGLLARDIDVHADVGDISVTGIDLVGNASMRTDVGSVDARFASVQTGEIEAITEVGEIGIELPKRMDVGYAVEAAGDVADIEIDIGETESATHEAEGPSSSASARSSGYAQKLVQVVVRATSEVGDIWIVASE